MQTMDAETWNNLDFKQVRKMHNYGHENGI